jgi:hypothetical protein
MQRSDEVSNSSEVIHRLEQQVENWAKDMGDRVLENLPR